LLRAGDNIAFDDRQQQRLDILDIERASLAKFGTELVDFVGKQFFPVWASSSACLKI